MRIESTNTRTANYFESLILYLVFHLAIFLSRSMVLKVYWSRVPGASGMTPCDVTARGSELLIEMEWICVEQQHFNS